MTTVGSLNDRLDAAAEELEGARLSDEMSLADRLFETGQTRAAAVCAVRALVEHARGSVDPATLRAAQHLCASLEDLDRGIVGPLLQAAPLKGRPQPENTVDMEADIREEDEQ